MSFGYLAVTILNTVLRPTLSKWHYALLDYESKRPESISIVEYEQKWERNNELRIELFEIRETLIPYANLLAEAADVPSLLIT